MPPNTNIPSDSQQNVPGASSASAGVAHEPLHVPHKPATPAPNLSATAAASVAPVTPVTPPTAPNAAEPVVADFVPSVAPSTPLPPPPPVIAPSAEFTVTHVPVEGEVPAKNTSEKIIEPDPALKVPDVTLAPSVDASTVAQVLAPSEPSIEDQIADEEERQRILEERRKQTQGESERLFQVRKEYEDEVAPLLLDEKLAIERIDALEKKKHEATTPAEQRQIEEERWNEEEKRRAIEEVKWPISEKLEAVVAEIKSGESVFKEMLAETAESNARIGKLRTAAKLQDLKRDLELIILEREATESELEEYRLMREGLETELHETKEYDEVALQAEHVVDAKADTARTLYEERVLAEERHKLELRRREAEKKRWEAEDAIPGVTHSVLESEERLRKIKQEEAEVLAKIKALGA